MIESGGEHWFSDGATISFPWRRRTIYWLLSLLLFCLMNMFLCGIRTGHWFSLWAPPASEFLVDDLLAPLSIFNFPAQIAVIAVLTALLCTIPILIALLYNLLHAVPFILAIYLLGHNALLSLALFVSCAMVSFRPLRFKSKFVAVILAMIPEIIYWVIFVGKNPESDALRWAVLYSPWVIAFLLSVLIFGVVLTIGHFLRYRPGIILPIFTLLLAGTILLFNLAVGMDQRDYQAEVFRYSPDQVSRFENRSIAPLIEREAQQRTKETPGADPESIRRQIRTEWQMVFGPEIAAAVGNPNRANPTSLASAELAEFYRARNEAVDHIDGFLQRHHDDRHVPDALYYKGLLIDLKVDGRGLLQEDMLKFYYTRPTANSEWIWKLILEHFPQHELSIEARVRLALLTAARPDPAQDNFTLALEMLEKAQQLCATNLRERENGNSKNKILNNWLGGVFTAPPPTLSTDRLMRLDWQIGQLRSLLGPENHHGQGIYRERLARFIALDPQQANYEEQLKAFVKESPARATGEPDPLIDNLELAQVELIKDPQTQMAALRELARRYPERDGGLEASLLLAQFALDQYNRAAPQAEIAKKLRQLCQDELNRIVQQRPERYPGPQALLMLQRLKNL